MLKLSSGEFGVSFSIKYAHEMGVDPKACLKAALKELGVKNLRLMSYWDLHEPRPGIYDFAELDWQFRMADKYGAKVSLAIGLRQPRWPESHWPSWVNKKNATWQNDLGDYIVAVVNRYKNSPCLESWQLENEALLKTFGLAGNFDRTRLQKEFTLVKTSDKIHPVIMTTSDSWGIPLRRPRPDIYGISIYRRFYDRGKYRQSRRPALLYRFRGILIRLLTGKPVFIHELQSEPWGPTATVGLDLCEQAITMNPDYFLQAIQLAKRTHIMPAYLWGLEWWYWLKTVHNDDRLWRSAKKIFDNTR